MTVCVFAAHARWPSSRLCQDVAAAVRAETSSITEVLRTQRISRQTYYRWLSIGRGEFTEWWDGCPIDEIGRALCWELAMAVAQAHLDRAQTQLEQLRRLDENAQRY